MRGGLRYKSIVRLAWTGVAVALLVAARPAAATTTRGPGEGTLLIAREGRATAEALPAVSTHVVASVVGFVAQVRVRQTFNNPFDRPLEAIYVFPLPHDAAVSDLEVSIGDRRIATEIALRTEAAQRYEAARAEGRTAALLEQERPNVFTQSVTGIAPRSTVQVDIVYDLALSYRDGAYEFVYPMVVGPRHVPGTASGAPPSGHGTGPDTDQVPDGSRITPPSLPAGERSGRNVSLEVAIDPGKPIRSITSATHEISVARGGGGAAQSTAVRVTLIGRDRLPNRDFVLRYRLADASPVATLLAHRDQDGDAGTFSLLVEPPRAPTPSMIRPVELVFLVDTSGSMAGRPIALMKAAMRHAIGGLHARDTFRVLTFSGAAGELAAAPVPSRPAERRRALAAIDALEAAGTSELMAGLSAALAGAPADGRLRVVVLMTDGFVGNEKAVLAAAESAIGPDTRIFALGVGSSVNRYLLDRLAEVGRGTAEYVLADADAERAAADFARRLRSPVLSRIEIDWGGLAVSDVWPSSSALGDLFVGRPIAVTGRFRGKPPRRAAITVRGVSRGRAVSWKVPLVMTARADSEALPRLWARAAIAGLAREQLRSEDPSLAAGITALGLEHRLVTAYTSFVAVDERPGDRGVVRTYVIPVDAPAGSAGTGGEEIPHVVEGREPAPTPATPDLDRGEMVGGSTGASDMEEEELIRLSPGRAGSRWRFAVGLGVGDLSAPASGEGGLLVGAAQVRADTLVAGDIAVGARLGLLAREADEAPALAGLLFETSYLGLWRGALRLMAGAGPLLLAGDQGAVGLSAAIAIGARIPIEVRYLHAARSGGDLAGVTLGVELAF
ncbi:MAG TPA: VIT domain-containing protein [Kofleriaceae bacterium]|nr:VIT domain-containing protein [Kofleriaceae bacterium]